VGGKVVKIKKVTKKKILHQREAGKYQETFPKKENQISGRIIFVE